jgi:hypothetical protein
MTQTAAAATYEVSLRAVSKWIKLVREGRLRALKLGERNGAAITRWLHKRCLSIAIFVSCWAASSFRFCRGRIFSSNPHPNNGVS